MKTSKQGDTDITNYAAMAKRIKGAKTLEQVGRLDKSLNTLYSCGLFTTSELGRLDNLLVHRAIDLGRYA